MEFSIEQLKNLSQQDIEALKSLAKQLGENAKELTDEDIDEMVTSKTTHIVVARHKNVIVGMMTLAVYRIPYSRKGYLDDLVVDEQFRGNGLAPRLIEKTIILAKELKAHYVEFTSNPTREKANSLYEKLGFQKREANVYRMKFDYDQD